MDYRDIDLMSYLSGLGEELKIRTLEDRIKIQKLVLIGQCAGINIGNYRFSLYHKGPYSPQLAERYYNAKVLIDLGDRTYEEYRLNKGDQEIVKKFKPILKPRRGVKLKESEWLEIIATLIFVYNEKKDWNFAKVVTGNEKKDLIKKSGMDLSKTIKQIQDTKAF